MVVPRFGGVPLSGGAAVRDALNGFAEGFAGATLRAEEPRPNFVVVFIDDMGQQDLGAFGGRAKTPHIDRLAGELPVRGSR